MPENEFVRLQPATKEDQRIRTANGAGIITELASCTEEKTGARAQDPSVVSFSANAARGFLIKTLDGSFFLRVYQEGSKENFSDYLVAHSDLEITIDDEDAYFYRSGEHIWLDHSPATLGIDEANRK
jgi:hypothetical protein